MTTIEETSLFDLIGHLPKNRQQALLADAMKECERLDKLIYKEFSLGLEGV